VVRLDCLRDFHFATSFAIACDGNLLGGFLAGVLAAVILHMKDAISHTVQDAQRKLRLVRYVLAGLTVLFSLVGFSARAQTTASCPVLPAALNLSGPNMFNLRQEQDLGSAYVEIEDAHLRFVNDSAAEAFLDRIGQKLLAVLPPNEFRFRYKIVDSPQVNAWSIAGGHIYFTRKLITASANEDEIAGVLAHEIGHILMHQQAIETTANLNDVLHVTSVSDRADIFDKIYRLRNAAKPWAWHPSGQKNEEIADAVAVYALMKAGYMPGAYAEFWNQVTQTKGKSGSVMGEIFHTTRPNEQRLRAILKNTAAIPQGCSTAMAPSVPPEFVAWRERIAADPTAVVATTAEDKATQLNPPLRSDFTRLQFSPDGKYALAQDRSSVFVLGLSPLRLLFQIDADDADPASFSPDSTRISFSTPSLRVEEWDLTSQQLLGAHEVLAYQPCLLHLLSPNGQVMACILNTSRTQSQLGLTLWDVEHGNVILQQDEAFDLSTLNVNFGFGFSYSSNYSWWVTYKLHWPLVRWAFTPDSKRLMVNHEPRTLVYDLDQRGFVKAGGAVAKLDRKPFALVGNDRIAIDNWDNPQKSALYSFPDGKELKQIAMGSQDLHSVTRGDYLMLTPMKDAVLGLLDLSTGQVPFKMANDVLDIYDKTVLMETGEGGVAVTSQGLVPGAKDSKSIDLPLSELGEISAVVVSADAKFLALSNKSRCAIWNAETGERIFSMRPFSGGYFDEADQFYGNFPKYRGQDHVQAVIDPRQRKSFKLAYPVADRANQSGDVLLEFKAVDSSLDLRKSADFEVRDVKTNQVLWTRHSLHEAPDLTTKAGTNEIVMTFDALYDGPGLQELKAHPELMAEQKALKSSMEGFLVEVLDKHSGAYLRGVVVDLRRSGWGSTTLRARAFGDFALIEGRLGSTVVHRFSTGARLGEVFGEIVAEDATSGLFCVSNRDNDLVIYDASTVRERKHFTYATRVRFAEFLPGRKELLVLTADQKVHAISMDDLRADRMSGHAGVDAALP
jgi:WD40 repeat protein